MQFDQIGTIEQLDVAASSLDGILCSSVVEYVQDPGGCLFGFQRALREGGLLVISVPNARSVFRRALRIANDITDTWPRYMRYSRNQYFRGDFETLLSNYGFVPLNFIVLGGPFPAMLQRKEFLGNLIMFMAEKRSGSQIT
jgi:2-polyprenyl-6-hydroxyphenyl methylase/3-demethylubiquinone-9 3-methyltransferase